MVPFSMTVNDPKPCSFQGHSIIWRRNGRRYWRSYNGILIMTYTRPTQVCNFEWPSVTCNDMCCCGSWVPRQIIMQNDTRAQTHRQTPPPNESQTYMHVFMTGQSSQNWQTRQASDRHTQPKAILARFFVAGGNNSQTEHLTMAIRSYLQSRWRQVLC